MTLQETLRRVVFLGLLGAGVSTGMKAGGESPDLSEKPGRPSLVLLSLDTTRADHLGPGGSSTALGSVTPMIDALAARGIRYTRALTPSPLSLPAHASTMTGLEPPEHGVRTNGTSALSLEILPEWDLSGVERDVRILFETALRAANADEQPRWVAGHEFEEEWQTLFGRE